MFDPGQPRAASVPPDGRVALPAGPVPPAGPACPVPVGVVDAVAMVEAGLAYLTSADLASEPVDTPGGVLAGPGPGRGAAHRGPVRRGHGVWCQPRVMKPMVSTPPGAWLRWQTRVTRGASSLAVSWARRLGAHPAVRDALAAG